ncbi:hypothetical protein PoB_003705100 [Plakobranchus ocellatus]|uniref:Uncharacterized protein n=1 Tax=Plakobranchus ocellatus TaxID=259542 RepID=A0AAV4AVH8_9GAST|nr:hypothetical protein PoB_003705100 [Plakobranchus ocellatus]
MLSVHRASSLVATAQCKPYGVMSPFPLLIVFSSLAVECLVVTLRSRQEMLPQKAGEKQTMLVVSLHLSRKEVAYSIPLGLRAVIDTVPRSANRPLAILHRKIVPQVSPLFA